MGYPTFVNGELKQYLLEDVLQYLDLLLTTFWEDTKQHYQHLSKAALTILHVPNGSCEAERASSKMQYVQQQECSQMLSELLKMQMVLFVNKNVLWTPLVDAATIVIAMNVDFCKRYAFLLFLMSINYTLYLLL